MQLAGLLPEAVTRGLETFRLEQKVRRHGPAVHDLLASIDRNIDTARIERLWAEVKPAFREHPTSAAKYANRRHWLLLNLHRAAQLGLQSSPKQRILDIGCGPGYFVAVTRALGHESFGADAPDFVLNELERRVYSELLAALNCSAYVSSLFVEKFVPLPISGQQYDLITAFWICFNRHRQPDTWGVEEWRFFVEDASRHIRPGGRLFLELNEDPQRFGPLRYYDEATLKYFQSVGSVDGKRITIAR